MANPKSLSRVSGLVFNATDYINLGHLDANSSLITELANVKIPYSDRVGSKTVLTERTLRVEGTMRQPTALWAARFSGGTIASGGLLYSRETLTKVTNDVTLTNGAGGGQSGLLIVRVYDTVNKSERKKVAATPVAQESYTLATKILTLNASDTGTVFDITYVYADSATVDGKIIIPTQTMPGQCRLLLAEQLFNPDTGAITGWKVTDCAKCVPTEFSRSGGTGEFATYRVAFDVLNEVDGDVVEYWNGYNPGF